MIIISIVKTWNGIMSCFLMLQELHFAFKFNKLPSSSTSIFSFSLLEIPPVQSLSLLSWSLHLIVFWLLSKDFHVFFFAGFWVGFLVAFPFAVVFVAPFFVFFIVFLAAFFFCRFPALCDDFFTGFLPVLTAAFTFF